MDGEGSYRWVIENVATGDWLGTSIRAAGEETAEFGARLPIMSADARGAKEIWRRYCRLIGYTKRGISLAGVKDPDERGPNHDAMPRVVYRQVMILPTEFAVDEGGTGGRS